MLHNTALTSYRSLQAWNPWLLLRRLWRQRELIRQLILRDIQQRYRGSYLGILWSFLTPFATLMIYTFVFSSILEARWSGGERPVSLGEFALILFAGLIPFYMFTECLNRAPVLVIASPNYVKKVVFPLEILPVVVAGSATVHSLISVGALLIGALLVQRPLSVGLFLLPLAYVPLILLALGVGWFLSALGVYVRDFGQGVAVVANMLMFLAPILYPEDAAPVWMQPVLYFNPLTTIVALFRAPILPSQVIRWEIWILWLFLSALIAYLGHMWFMISKRGFADVL